MTQTRRILLLVLACALLLAAAGCGGKKNDLPKATPSSGKATEPVVPYTATPSSTEPSTTRAPMGIDAGWPQSALKC